MQNSRGKIIAKCGGVPAGHRALRFGLRGESMSEEPVVVGDEVEVEFLELGSFKGEVVKVTGSTSFDVHFPCDGST